MTNIQRGTAKVLQLSPYAEVIYLGRNSTAPTADGERVVITWARGGLIHLTNTETGKVTRLGTATKLWVDTEPEPEVPATYRGFDLFHSLANDALNARPNDDAPADAFPIAGRNWAELKPVIDYYHDTWKK